MSSWEEGRTDRAVDAILGDARRLAVTLALGPAVAGMATPVFVEGGTLVGTFLSALALALGVALFVLFVGTRALDTVRSGVAAVALAAVSLLAGIGLSLVAWPGVAGALLSAGSGIATGARATAIARSVA